MINRIVTRGFGPSRGNPGLAGPITMGYGGVPTFVVETFTNIASPRRVNGGSGRRPNDELQTVILWAKLIEVNSRSPNVRIEGSVKVPIDPRPLRATAERIATNIKEAWNVTVTRIKR